MNCCITDLTRKEVINVRNGNCLGNIGDVEVNVKTGQVVAILVFAPRFMPGFGKNEHIRVCWEDIKVIGEDTVLVDVDGEKFRYREEKRGFFDSMFRH